MTALVWLLGVLAALWLLSSLLARHVQGLALLLTGSSRVATASYDLLVLPGVVLHELSHVLFALLLGIRVRRIHLFQFRRHDDPRQGEVVIDKVDPWRMSLVGAAPLIGGVAALFLLVRFIDPPSVGLNLAALTQLRPLLSTPLSAIGLYLLIAVANTMFPSEADRKAWWVVGVALALGAIVLLVTGVRPALPPAWLDTLAAQADRLSVALLPVVGVDLACLVIVLALETLVGRVRGRRVIYRAHGRSHRL